MEREIIITADGSTTIHMPQWNEQYHSKHGAVQEAQHVFIQMGLQHIIAQLNVEVLHILEIGFGTGLNTLLTYYEALTQAQKIQYVGIEAYPVALSEVALMNYPHMLETANTKAVFEKLHQTSWETPVTIAPDFVLTKRKQFFEEISEKESMHLIYFDAFGARVQPELWTKTLFAKMYEALLSNGVLVTYSAKGSVRRAMQEVGFKVERLPGPPGKREMLRATKQ